MADRPDITPELCRLFIEYDASSGGLTWRQRDLSFFKDERSCRSWNSKHAGKPALNAECRRPDGSLARLIGQILQRPMKAHRVAWAIFHGAWPVGQIDHINGNPADNRIDNLRDVTHSDNMRNAAMHRDNRSGAAGVIWNPRTRKWTAVLGINKRAKYLGQYATVAEASEARKAALAKYGFHLNHGRRVPPN